jgi:hypothetical protein
MGRALERTSAVQSPCGGIHRWAISWARRPARAQGSEGIWRLSRIEWNGEAGPYLLPVDHMLMDQSLDDCHLRSSGTVHADADNRLVFYCHERSVSYATGEETFHFTVGTLYEDE